MCSLHGTMRLTQVALPHGGLHPAHPIRSAVHPLNATGHRPSQ